jgi:hypothetical protein
MVISMLSKHLSYNNVVDRIVNTNMDSLGNKKKAENSEKRFTD